MCTVVGDNMEANPPPKLSVSKLVGVPYPFPASGAPKAQATRDGKRRKREKKAKKRIGVSLQEWAGATKLMSMILLVSGS